MDINNILPVEGDCAWVFFKKACAINPPNSTVAHNVPRVYKEKVTALTELGKLATIRCLDCTGYGHSARDCITREKLTELKKWSLTAAQLISGSRTAMKQEYKVELANH